MNYKVHSRRGCKIIHPSRTALSILVSTLLVNYTVLVDTCLFPTMHAHVYGRITPAPLCLYTLILWTYTHPWCWTTHVSGFSPHTPMSRMFYISNTERYTLSYNTFTCRVIKQYPCNLVTFGKAVSLIDIYMPNLWSDTRPFLACYPSMFWPNTRPCYGTSHICVTQDARPDG